MTGFQPQIPFSGIAGWRFLERTAPVLQATFEKGPQIQRDIAHFAEKIGTISSAADLVADRQLMRVALGAFGLDGEIDKRAFIRRVLEDDLDDPRALANRLTEPAYREMAVAFGFGTEGGARTGDAGFASKIIADYKTRAFEVAVGESNNAMRLALNFRREMAEMSQGDGASWFRVLGSKPLREVFEGAYGLPSQFGRIDVDQQRDVMRDKTSRLFGGSDLTVFQDPEAVEKVINRFLARAQIDAGVSASGPASNALALLQAGSTGGGAEGLFSLLAQRSGR